MPTIIEKTNKEEVDYNYPLLTEDSLVSELSEQLRALTLKMTAVKVRLDDKVAEIRRNCPHDNTTSNWEKDPNYRIRFEGGSSEYGQKALVSKTCDGCGETIKRSKGREYQICFKCWGPMKYVGANPGQGSCEKIYECENCGSAVSHT
ncbi:MAG: hypothetical protein KBF62_00465 [Candidatus Pacebacteria bacterium]|nr:hypothetical protein [Candidatus Paceibacterota bacterium]